MLPVGQKVRPSMSVLSLGECRDGCRHAAARSARETRPNATRSEHDDVVATPASAEPGCRVSQHNGWSAGDRNLLQLAPCEECDEPAVRRPEWKRAALCSRHRLRRPHWPLVAARFGTRIVHRPRTRCGDHQARSQVVRCCPYLQRRDRQRTVFSGGGILNSTRSGASCAGSGHSQGDDRCGDHAITANAATSQAMRFDRDATGTVGARLAW